jgi:hypothetical protein
MPQAEDVIPTCADLTRMKLCDTAWVQSGQYCAQTCGRSARGCHDRAPYCSEVVYEGLCTQNWLRDSRLCKETCSTAPTVPTVMPTHVAPTVMPTHVAPTAITPTGSVTTSTAPVTTPSSQFWLGVNVPWLNGRYGWQFGTHRNWGRGYTPEVSSYAKKFFRDLDAAIPQVPGVGVLSRIFVFGDMRGGLDMRDSRVEALPTQTVQDIVDFLDSAKGTRVKIILSLIDFHTCDERCALFWDDGNLSAFIDKVVRPLLKSIHDHPAVFGIEPGNELEWAIRDSGRAFTKQQMGIWNAQRYCAMVNTVTKRETNFVRVDGSASAMWMRFWTDEVLKQAYPEGGSDVVFDMYAPHMYSFSAPDWDLFSKRPTDFPDNGRKPMTIGETGKNDPLSFEEKLRRACDNGYAGLLLWSYGASDGVATWDDIRPALQSFSGCRRSST